MLDVCIFALHWGFWVVFCLQFALFAVVAFRLL